MSESLSLTLEQDGYKIALSPSGFSVRAAGRQYTQYDDPQDRYLFVPLADLEGLSALTLQFHTRAAKLGLATLPLPRDQALVELEQELSEARLDALAFESETLRYETTLIRIIDHAYDGDMVLKLAKDALDGI